MLEGTYRAPLAVADALKGLKMRDKEFPKVSIMIPTYNQKSFIAKAIESALMQNYENLEVVVSDDCSADGTSSVVALYLADERIRYYRNERNLGRLGNYRETLHQRATGEWALNLDGDDYLYAADSVSSMVSDILAHSDRNVVAVLGSQLTINAGDGYAARPYTNYKTGVFSGFDIFLGWDRLNFGHLATLYRTDLAKEIDYYRLGTISSDWESALRLILHGDVIVTDKIISVWNIHGGNATATARMADGIKDYSYIEETYKYAYGRGLDKAAIDGWLRRMVRFHTRSLWISRCSLSDKIRTLLPHVLKKYPFAAREFLSASAAAKMILRAHPPSHAKLRSLYLKHKARRA